MAITTTKSTQGSLIVPDYRGHEKLVVRHILQFTPSQMYPDYQLPEVESCQLGPQKLKEIKKEKMAQLLNAIACGEPVKTTTKYHVLLPTE